MSAAVIDIAVALAVLFIEAGPMLAGAPPWHVYDVGVIDIVRLLGFCVPLAFMRRAPLIVLVIVVASFLGSHLLGLGLAVAFFGVGAYESDSTRTRLAVAIGIATVVGSMIAWRNLGVPFDASIPVVAFGGAWFAGQTMQLRRRYTVALEERAARLETEKDENERRAVAAERARIARDLHDIVAHRVSMITVQAGAAHAVGGKDPDAARRAIPLIEEAGRQTLWELRRLLDVMRETGDGEDVAPRPQLAQLTKLVDDVRAAGTPVTLSIDGDASRIPDAVQVSAYRIVQEALTNVMRHAGPGAEARVDLRCADDVVEIVITDSGRGASERLPGGHGLIGMAERAAVFGGTVAAGPLYEGGFAVKVHIPTTGPR